MVLVLFRKYRNGVKAGLHRAKNWRQSGELCLAANARRRASNNLTPGKGNCQKDRFPLASSSRLRNFFQIAWQVISNNRMKILIMSLFYKNTLIMSDNTGNNVANALRRPPAFRAFSPSRRTLGVVPPRLFLPREVRSM